MQCDVFRIARIPHESVLSSPHVDYQVAATALNHHGHVAFLPFRRITFKSLKNKALAIEPRTIGEHIKRKRALDGLTQEEAARIIDVDKFTVLN